MGKKDLSDEWCKDSLKCLFKTIILNGTKTNKFRNPCRNGNTTINKIFWFFQPPAEGATTIHKNQWHFISTIHGNKQTTRWTPYTSVAISELLLALPKFLLILSFNGWARSWLGSRPSDCIADNQPQIFDGTNASGKYSSNTKPIVIYSR